VNRNTFLVIALVLLLLAGPLIWIASMEPAAPRTPGKGAAPARSSASAAQRRPRERAAAETAPPASVAPAATPAPRATDPETPATPPRAVLKCRLEGLDPEVPPANTIVFVERVGERRSPTVQVDAGTAEIFDVDVTPLLLDDGTVAELAITAERRGYLTATGAASVWAPGRQVTETVPVQLRLRVAGWVTAIVQDERFERVAGADAGAWVYAAGAWAKVDQARTDDEGVFRMRLRPDEANLVVVMAAGKAPASAMVTGVARAESELMPITLQPGLAFSGSVTFADGRPMSDATVIAAPVWMGTKLTDVTLGRVRLAYRGGLIFQSPAVAPVAEGNYRIEGLVPGDYDLGVSARGYAADLLATVRRRASPPLERVDFVLDPARVVVRVTADGRPVPRLAVPVANADGGVSVETDAKGEAVFFLKPRTGYSIEFQPAGYEKYGRTFSAPAPGEEMTVTVELRRRTPWPHLVLRLAPEDAYGDGALEAADVVMTLADAEPGSPPERSETVAFARGQATVDGLFAGSYVVRVTPRGPGYRLPVVRRAILREGGAARLDLRLPHGGRIKIVARDPAGVPAAAAWRVLADERDVEFAHGDAGSGDDPLVPPGRYRVVATPAGGEPVTARVTVVADATAEALLKVVPPRKAE
jgi:hypothetical protein